MTPAKEYNPVREFEISDKLSRIELSDTMPRLRKSNYYANISVEYSSLYGLQSETYSENPNMIKLDGSETVLLADHTIHHRHIRGSRRYG